MADGKTYSEAHQDRVEILNRAGWRILHVPYYRWWHNGRLVRTGHSKRIEIEQELAKDLTRILHEK